MGLLTDTNFSGSASQRPGGGGMQQPSLQSMLAQRLMQNAMKRRQENPLSKILSAPPPGLDMMPELAGGPPRQPVGALPGGGAAVNLPHIGGPSVPTAIPGSTNSEVQGALSSMPKTFSGMGMGDTAPQVSAPSDSGALSQMSGGASSKMGDSFSAPSSLPWKPGMGAAGAAIAPNMQGFGGATPDLDQAFLQSLGGGFSGNGAGMNGSRMEMIMKMLNSMNGGGQ